MRDYAFRAEKRWRFARRRFNAANLDPFWHGFQRINEPSDRFIWSDFRLIACWVMARLENLARWLSWRETEHCCSCRICTAHKRNGTNSWNRKPIQERREWLVE